MNDLTLEYPWFLAALALLPLVAWFRSRRSTVALSVPFAAEWFRPDPVPTARLPEFLAYAGLTLLIGALARPQKIQSSVETRQQGYDIILAVDLSGSMLAEDYSNGIGRINRLQAIKPVIEAFINQRTSDRIGIVLFSGRAYTLAPLTFDHDWLRRQTERLKIGLLEDGTAIGDGLAVALTRLEQAGRSDGNARKGAFVILLTDGANNRGTIPPLEAATLAKSRNIPVYTIGAGREGYVPMPLMDQGGNILGYRQWKSDLDEDTLRKIASLTGASYFKADDSATITEAFNAIDKAQKIDFQSKAHRQVTEFFHLFAAPGLACWFLAALLLPAGLREEAGS